jgi:LuxR family transcriptional regulator, maltose regulon positive regulatory protein
VSATIAESTPELVRGPHNVTLNTVKTHAKSIYRKLDVDGRDEAVNRARELKVL